MCVCLCGVLCQTWSACVMAWWCTLWLVIDLGSVLTMLAQSARVCLSFSGVWSFCVGLCVHVAFWLQFFFCLCASTMYDFRSRPSLSLGTKVVTFAWKRDCA